MDGTTTRLIATAFVCWAAAAAIAAGGDTEGWRPLFDGKSLAGWTQRNGTATYQGPRGPPAKPPGQYRVVYDEPPPPGNFVDDLPYPDTCDRALCGAPPRGRR